MRRRRRGEREPRKERAAGETPKSPEEGATGEAAPAPEEVLEGTSGEAVPGPAEREEPAAREEVASEEPAARQEMASEKPAALEEAQPTEREAELIDRLTRLMADFDNYRKRARREAAEAEHQFRSRFIRKLLPVLDDYHRARANASMGKAGASEREALLTILGRLADMLEKEGLEALEVSPGDSFDPRIHEAILTAPSSHIPAQHIVEVFERGYRLGSDLLRPARVIVSQGPPAGREEEEKEEEDGGDGRFGSPAAGDLGSEHPHPDR